MKRCGAKTRSGSPCQKHPAEGSNRCHLHGGKSRKGPDHPGWKHGLYSKYAGRALKDVLSELDGKTGEDLINPENEIRLMEALILASKTLQSDLEDLEELETISKVIDRLVMAKQRSQKILLEQDRLIPASDIERFLKWMEELLIQQTDEGVAHSIINQLENFKLSDHALN